MTTLSSANTKYTAEQLTKATGISAETLATWGLTEATDTLTMSQLAEMASSDAQAKKVLEKIVAQNAQAVANGKVAASNATLTASETSATLATGSFTTAIKANIAAMWTWMTTTPLGLLTLLAAGVFAAVKAYDALTVSVEEQKEKVEESLSAYEDAKSELSNITTELDNQKQAIDDLLAKEKLTYAEKGQLEELQAITQELRIQKDLAEKEEERTQKQVATDTSDLFEKQFGKYDISESAIVGYQNDANVTGNNLALVSNKDDISAMIAGYRQYNELLDEAYGSGSQEDIDNYKSFMESLEDDIFSTAQALQAQKDNISDYYNTIKDTPYSQLLPEQKQVVDSYNSISNAIALIYKELDPNTWNTMQIDNLFATDGIEKTKEELIEMAKAGTLDESTIQSYSKLNSTLENSNMALNDGQSAASALCDELYALADAEGSVGESVPDETSIPFAEIIASLPTEKLEEYISLVKSGVIDEENINSYKELADAIKQTGLSSEDAYKALKEFVDSQSTSIELTSQIEKSYDVLTSVKEEFKKTKQISLDTLSSIANMYPELTLATSQYAQGLITEQDLIYQLEQAYQSDVDAYKTAMVNKLSEDETFFQQVYSHNESFFTDLAKAYDTDVKNWKNLADVKKTIDERLIQNLSKAWSKYYKIVLNPVTGMYNLKDQEGIQKTGLTADQSVDLIVSKVNAEQEMNSLNQLVSQLDELAKIEIDTPDFGGIGSSKDKTKGTNSKDTKQTIDWIDRKLSVLRSNIDTTKTKFDNLFNLKSPKNLAARIKLVSTALTESQKNADKFKKNLNSIKLPEKIKKQIESGKKVDTKGLSSTEKKNIEKYQKNWEKYTKYNSKTNKYTEKLETLRGSIGKQNNLSLQIKQMEALRKADTKAISVYKSYANNVKLSSDLKKKVKSGNYNIEDYSSDTQALIQEYQGYIDKIRELEDEKITLVKDIKDAKIQKYQLNVDDAEAKIAKSQALAALVEGDYKAQNKQLQLQQKYLEVSYRNQIKIAEAENNTLEVERLRAEYSKAIADNIKEQFDNIDASYKLRLDYDDSKIKAFQDQISLIEAKGMDVGTRLYTKQMELVQSKINRLTNERAAQINKVASLEKNSKAWYEAQQAIFETESELVQCQIEIENLQTSINNLKFDRFDDLLQKISDIVDESNFLKDMLSDNLFDDNGMITDDGITAMGLTAQNYDVYLAEAAKYKQMLADLDQMKEQGLLSDNEYEEKVRQYKNGQQDILKSANDAKKALIDYVKQGLDAQTKALEEAVSKQKELLQAEKDLKSFQDSLAKSDKSIARLERQIAVLSGDDSEENRKRLRELKSQLEDARKEREDLLYDKSIEDQEKALDQMLKNSEEQAENYLKDTEKVFIDAINYVNANTSVVADNIEQIAAKTGYDVSKYITNAWKESGNAVGGYYNTLVDNVSGISVQIGLISAAWQQACQAAEQYAAAAVAATTAQYQQHITVGKPVGSTSMALELSNAKKYISKNSVTPTKSASSYSALNQYIYAQTGKILPEDKQGGLASALGINNVGKDTTILDRNKILDALKKAGFSSGGFVNVKDAIRYSGEDGVALVRNDEYILSPKLTDGFLTLAENAPQLAETLKNMTLPQFSYPQIDRNIPIANRTPTVVNNTFDNRVTVEGVATDKIVKDMEGVAKKQAENVITEINRRTYAKGVRWK